MYKTEKRNPAFKITAIILAAILLFFSAKSFAVTYKVDKDHSRVGFTVRHLMLTNIHGQFNDFSGTFDFDPVKNSLANTTFVVQTGSVYTGVEKRDAQLKSADFFDSAKFPTMTLENVSIKRAGKDAFKYKLTGDLSIHGVKKKQTFDFVYAGTKKTKAGETRAGFSLKGKINRSDYGMNWSAPIEGDVMINKEVFIDIDISAVELDTKVPAGGDKLYKE